jgi:hypothetical protein
MERILGAIAACAPSFEAFLYRYWLENTIWFALNEQHAPLTPPQQQYLHHYSSVQNSHDGTKPTNGVP